MKASQRYNQATTKYTWPCYHSWATKNMFRPFRKSFNQLTTSQNQARFFDFWTLYCRTRRLRLSCLLSTRGIKTFWKACSKTQGRTSNWSSYCWKRIHQPKISTSLSNTSWTMFLISWLLLSFHRLNCLAIRIQEKNWT